MKITLRPCAALVLATLAPQAMAKPVSCPGFAEGKGSSPVDVDRFYAERAAAIVTAALTGDTAKVRAWVASGADFATWRGDYSTGGRQSGPSGAIEWAKDLRAVRFESLIARRGPISNMASSCEADAAILFRTSDSGTGVNVTFRFAGGLLVEATGREVLLLEGDVR